VPTMICTIETLQTVLNELYTKLKQLYGSDLDKVILYGSYARGDYREYSDIDVMALVKSSEEQIKELHDDLIDIRSDLGIEYDVVLSVYVKNKEYFDRWKEHMPYFRNVATEGVEISA